MAVPDVTSSRLIEGVGDEVLFTLIACFAIGAFAIHYISRRRTRNLAASQPTVVPVVEEPQSEGPAPVVEEVVDDPVEDQPLPQEEWPAGAVAVTVKFLDDRRQEVFYLPNERVSDFKERSFPSVVSRGQWVRLVHAGRELRDDMTMAAFHLPSSCVLHCVMTERRPSGDERRPGDGGDSSEEGFEPGAFLVPLLGLVLGLVWVWVMVDSSAFRRSSILILIGFTILFGYLVADAFGVSSENSGRQQR